MLAELGFIKNDKAKLLLEDVVKIAKEIIKDKLMQVVLFGSYARGSEEEYSDMDIMILINDSVENIKKFDRQLEDINHELILKYEILIIPILINYTQFKEYRDVLPFFMNILKDGIVVYERKAA